MEFKTFNQIFNTHWQEMIASRPQLFKMAIDPDLLWETYLESFPPGTNEIFRERREFDCSCCRSFIKKYGGLVKIANGEVVSIWDFDPQDPTYTPVVNALSNLVHQHHLENLAVESDKVLGTPLSYEQFENGIHTWHHFSLELPREMLYKLRTPKNEYLAGKKADHDVFYRSLEEITSESVETVLDLIEEGMVYRGNEWKKNLKRFKIAQKQFELHHTDEYLWEGVISQRPQVLRMKNTSMGTLLSDLSAGVDVNLALERFGRTVDPVNYRRPKNLAFTKTMLESAKKELENLGLLNSLQQKHATLRDLTVNNVLWVNRKARKAMQGLDIFEELSQEITVDARSFKNLPGISLATFLEDILPQTETLEVLFTSDKIRNLVSLLAPNDPSSPPLFKWGNGFSWAYRGNVADSMKEQVKAAGGLVDVPLRVSLRWNEDGNSIVDLDLHAQESNGQYIFYGTPYRKDRGDRRTLQSGQLDVDMIDPRDTGIENITWTDKRKIEPGEIIIRVNNFNHKKVDFFEIEIQADDELYHYAHQGMLTGTEEVARINFDGHTFEVNLPKSATSSTFVWGLTTNQFIPVSTVLLSPNHWDGYAEQGNKHFFFMLSNCHNDESPNGFYNEYLHPSLNKHRKVLEVLGQKLKVLPTEEELSGLGFADTQRSDLVVKANGKPYRIIF